jgi:hypothetical protein
LPNKKFADYLRKSKKLIFLNNICLTSILQNFSQTKAGPLWPARLPRGLSVGQAFFVRFCHCDFQESNISSLSLFYFDVARQLSYPVMDNGIIFLLYPKIA